MSNKKITDLTALTSVASDDYLHIVDTSDTTDSSDGTSKKITRDNLVANLVPSNITGLTASVDELNILDGATLSVDELNVLDGIPATLTSTEIGYLDGVTSAVQTQIDSKALSGANSDITSLSGLTTPLTVAQGGIGRANQTAYAVVCGGTTTTAAQQSIVSVGTSGQVLTSNGAGALPTFQTPTATGKSSVRFDWSNVVLPDTNFPAISKVSGTNWIYKTLDFDKTTDEACYWNHQIPSDLTPTSGKLIIHWTAAAGTATQIARWGVTLRYTTNDEVIDAVTTPDSVGITVGDALIATGDLHIVELDLTGSLGSAGDLMQIKFYRDADGTSGTDSLDADARVLAVFLELR